MSIIPKGREYKKVLIFLNEAKRRIDQLGFFPSYFEEGELDIHYNLDVAIESIITEIRNNPTYVPLAPLLQIEQTYLEEALMWNSFKTLEMKH